MAALVGLDDLRLLEERREEQKLKEGLLAAARALADYEEFEEVMAEIYRARGRSRGRKVKLD